MSYNKNMHTKVHKVCYVGIFYADIHFITSENWILMYLSGNTNSACYILQNFVCMYTLKWSVDVHDIGS